MKTPWLIPFLLFPGLVFTQNYDQNWLMGYFGGLQSEPDDVFGISILDFSDCTLTIHDNQNIEMNFDVTNVSMSNEVGDLIFYSNGIYIENSSFQTMENGTDLNEWQLIGYILNQGILSIPYPGNENQYIVFHGTKELLPGIGINMVGLYYSIIDMEANNGLGQVIEKNQSLILDTLQSGKLTATKHGNGRDWWLLINKSSTNNFHTILINPSGISISGIQSTGLPIENGLGQAVFSPNGNYFVKFNTIDLFTGQFIEIYNFDRCRGLLSNHRRIQYDEDASSGGVAISPNSRFLYVSSYKQIYQFDLWATDIESSKIKVAEYDGFQSPFGSKFFLAQLAPDGKIYINCPNSENVLHVIHNPNEPGLDCNVEQHGIELPTVNGFSLPNYPNYRLGPIDGSPCDTLGIDNLPLAGFRYEKDTVDEYLIYFTDLSYYEPETWSWNFGDTQTSTEVNPNHLFNTDGLYEVCLTVNNQYGSDTYCKSIQIGVVKTKENFPTIDLKLFPNPAKDQVTLFSSIAFQKKCEWILYNQLGQVIDHQMLSRDQQVHTLLLKDAPSGIYYYSVLQKEQKIGDGKLIIQE